MTDREPSPHAARQRWMSILARAGRQELQEALAPHAAARETLKPAETGTVMVEARAGGTGTRFNLGEATVTRCVIRLADGRLGHAYALGTDRAKAEAAAVIDALLQDSAHPLHGAIDRMEAAQRAARDLASRKAAATKVDFFTMVRGD